MTTTAALRALRRYLVLMLMAALAVNAWTLPDFGEREGAASGPWQSEQTVDASAIIENSGELDAVEDAAGDRATIALAGFGTSIALSEATRHLPAIDSAFSPSSPTFLPNKTGPPPSV